MESRAVGRLLRLSPYKAQLELDEIRGMKALEAQTVLEHSPRKGAALVNKILKSAIANAENDKLLTADQLVVSEATVGRGTVLKRLRPRARGRADRILKRTSNITIVLSSAEKGA